MYVGLNCTMGAAELGRLLLDDIVLEQAHPLRDQLRFESTDDDSFIRYFRPKTDVFGEWLLWPPVAEFLVWGIERAQRLNSRVLFVSENGNPLFVEHSKNAQAGFQNQWNDLLDGCGRASLRFRGCLSAHSGIRSPTSFVRISRVVMNLRVCVFVMESRAKPISCSTVTTTSRSAPLHKRLRSLFKHFEPVFAIDNVTDQRKHYLPMDTHESMQVMGRSGDSVAEISRQLNVHPSTVYRLTAPSPESAG